MSKRARDEDKENNDNDFLAEPLKKEARREEEEGTKALSVPLPQVLSLSPLSHVSLFPFIIPSRINPNILRGTILKHSIKRTNLE
jgi:hypothetical protein